jgi:pimeloyl-ACP methyl ester carboxylesterase
MKTNHEQSYIDWLDLNEYPFEQRYFDSRHGKIHYIDEGKGESIVFVHGTPTWSFLYRNYVKSLSSKYRCLAIDHLGFGLSDKPKDFIGTPEAHAKNFSRWVDALKLEKFTLVVHDFGGPIALSYAIKNPEKISKIIMFNTWLWETQNNKDAIKIDKILHSTIGNYLYLNTNFSPKYLLKKAFVDKKKLTPHIHQHYMKPFKNKHDRYGLLKLGRSLIGSSDWYEEQWKQISNIKNIPFLILWGVQDQFIKKEELIKWKNSLKNAKLIEFNCGHFVQEEEFEVSLMLLRKFLENEVGSNICN